MQELSGKTAVITGAASGFGRELAILCAQEGMKLVLADRDEAGMQGTVELLPKGTETLCQRCDVSVAADLDALADAAYRRFGAVHLLFNNAGVAVTGPAWSATLEDWKWVLGVNLMGVVHGIKSFVPRMLAQGGEAHVVNTSSVAGLLAVTGSACYGVSKHGVVVLSEILHHDLRTVKSSIGVSVLCPAYVNTGIADSGRNRPSELAATNPHSKAYDERVRHAVRSGKLSAADVAKATLEGVKENRFYILTHPELNPAIEDRMKAIVEGRPPARAM